MQSIRRFQILLFSFSLIAISACDDGGGKKQENNNNSNNTNAVCGNGVREGAEPCDGTDFGTRTCASEGYHAGGELACTASCTLDASACLTECGNGFVEPGEGCDAGTAGDPGCSSQCTVNPGWSCSGQPSVCVRTCGNGVRDPGEACEGDDVGDATCEAQGWGYGYPTCNADCGLDASGCFTITAIAAGYYHTCVLDSLGRVWCWGDNTFGQLGNGTSEMKSAQPVRITEISDAAAISAGEYHTCTLLANHTVKCWGGNIYGELGNGTTTPSATPVAVSNITDAVALSSGRNHNCVVQQAGTLRCWGSNFDGKLGNGSTSQPAFPVAVTGIANAVDVVAAENHTCALLGDATVKCWGSNALGQLGTGTAIPNSTTPVAVAGLSGVDALSAGGFHTCALLGDATVKCWGSNASGELGNGTTTDSNSPVSATATGVAGVRCGGAHTCALYEDGTLGCWGSNEYGQLGDGSSDPLSTSSRSVAGLAGASVFGTGFSHNCAVDGGRLFCWGDNAFSQCASGEDNTLRAPSPVSF